MNESVPQSLMQEVGAVIRDRLGLDFPPGRSRELETALNVVAGAFACADAEQCARRIVTRSLDADELKTLAQALTVGETNFFRDPEVFQALERDILPPLIEQRRGADRRLRIWSAGCCTGEEAYTIAIILRRLLPDYEDWNLTLLATDLNPHFLARAGAGVYGKWSFRRATPWALRRHVAATAGGKYEVDESIRDMVAFDYLNLAEGRYPSVFNNTNAMDIVFCRNVLIYFDPSTVERVIEHLRSCLLPGGWLALGRSERVPDVVERLRPVVVRGDVWYRRDDSATAQAAVPAAAGAAPPVVRVARATPFPASLQRRFDDGDYAAVAAAVTDYLHGPPPCSTDRRRAMRMLAQAHANLGELDAAQTWCEEAISEDKLDPRLHYLMASVLLERNRAAEAEECLRRALVADDRFVLAHFALGNLTRRHRESDDARGHFERTLSLLRHFRSDEIIPDSEGLTAGRLSEIAEHALLQC